MRSADEIAYEITAVYYDDDKVVRWIRAAREDMRIACVHAITDSNGGTEGIELEIEAIYAIPNR